MEGAGARAKLRHKMAIQLLPTETQEQPKEKRKKARNRSIGGKLEKETKEELTRKESNLDDWEVGKGKRNPTKGRAPGKGRGGHLKGKVGNYHSRNKLGKFQKGGHHYY